MYKTRVPRILSYLTIFSLLFMFVAGPGLQASAQTSSASVPSTRVRISSALLNMLNWRPGSTERVRVIVQLSGTPGAQLNSFLSSTTVRNRRDFSSFKSFAVELPLSAVGRLASFPEVKVVSEDKPVRGSGHVVTTTGADLIRTMPAIKGSGTMTVDGTGIGIAVLDSGIYTDHLALTDASGGKRKSSIRISRARNARTTPTVTAPMSPRPPPATTACRARRLPSTRASRRTRPSSACGS